MNATTAAAKQALGRFYIQATLPNKSRLYWSQYAQNWTRDPFSASTFTYREDAESETRYAREYTDQIMKADDVQIEVLQMAVVTP